MLVIAILPVLFCMLLSYLIGSISPGIIVSKLAGKGDIREHGSKGTGATNVQRTVGTTAGITVFLLDAFKGVIAVFVANAIFKQFWPQVVLDWIPSGLQSAVLLLFASAAILGHIFPVYYKFKGGKGVATAFALLIIIDWPIALMAFAVFFAIVFGTRYISLGSVLGTISYPILVALFSRETPWAPWFIGNGDKIAFSAVVALMIMYTHRTNIKRLLKGVENKISFKKKESV
jgi:glycerol-3-phosphate acyltransferase PlsY